MKFSVNLQVQDIYERRRPGEATKCSVQLGGEFSPLLGVEMCLRDLDQDMTEKLRKADKLKVTIELVD